MSSQFKRKKTPNLKNRSRDTSIISASKRMTSNNNEEFKTEMQGVQKENDNMLGSLIGEQQEDRSVNDIVKRVEMSQKLTTNRESKHGTQNKKDIKSEQITNIEYDKEAEIDNNEQEKQENIIPEKTEENKIDVDTQRDISNKTVNDPEEEDDKPKEKQYGEDPEVALLVLTLKNFIKTTDEDNSRLKNKNLDFTVKEQEYQQRIKDLSTTAEELELERKLMNEKPSEHIKFDLEDLESRLNVMNDNLQKATGENSQEKFLEEIISRNKNFNDKTQANTAAMKKLRENLANLRSTLLGITSK